MLEMFVVRETVFFLTGVMIGIGAMTRLITGISLKRLVKAASNMSKSNHPLMRLVRAKFEHGCMVSDKVQNVDAFVEKYLYEYRVFGVRLHTWRQWAKGSIWLCLLFGAAGTALAYVAGEREQGLYRYGILGGVGAVALFIFRMLADDAYQLKWANTHMVDFLENTYAHRYAKTNQKEIQVTVQRTDEVPEKLDVEEKQYAGDVDKGSYAEDQSIEKHKKFTEKANETQVDERQTRQSGTRMEDIAGSRFKQEDTVDKLEPAKEARIREILEEFLA